MPFPALFRAVFQLHDFRFALCVHGYDEKIVKLLLVNGRNDISAEHFDYVRNRIAVTDHEYTVASVLENFVGDLRRRLFRDLSWIRRIRFQRKRRDS